MEEGYFAFEVYVLLSTQFSGIMFIPLFGFFFFLFSVQPCPWERKLSQFNSSYNTNRR